MQPAAASPGRLAFADLELDEDTHEVWRAGREIELTATEFKLLRYLLLNARRVLSKDQILDHVWNYDFGGDANIVETYVSYLRRKVDAEGAAPDPHRARRRLQPAPAQGLMPEAMRSRASTIERPPARRAQRRTD